MKRQFSDLSSDEVHNICLRCVDAIIAYGRTMGVDGLAKPGSHNVYGAVQTAVLREWEKAKLGSKLSEPGERPEHNLGDLNANEH